MKYGMQSQRSQRQPDPAIQRQPLPTDPSWSDSTIAKSLSGIPPRKLNGGLYTGEPFASSAWGNVPMVPDAGSMVNESLRIGNVPPYEARYQYVSYPRPGNSAPTMPGLVDDDYLQMSFVPCEGEQSGDCSPLTPTRL